MKKRLITLWTALLLMLIPAGCTTAPSCPDVHAAVDTDMTLQYGGTEYTCHVRYVTKNNAVLTLLSPENLSGLTFHRSDSICTLSLGTLVCKGTQLLPQDTALAEAVFSVFDRLADPALSCTGTTSDGNYTFALSSAPALSLLTDSSGQPLSIRTDTLCLTRTHQEETAAPAAPSSD